MEIKVGDKVRVSKDVPRIFFGKCDMSQIEFTVGVVDKYVAGICIVNDEKTQMKAWIIPCKYLIKVDAEAKEPSAPTIKVGDRVCCYNVLHLKGSKKEDYMGIVTSITDMGIMVQLDNGGAMLSYRESDLELVQPKEQTEKKPNVGSIKIPVEVDLSGSYWDAYTADLAKEIAVMLVRTHRNDLNKVAKMSVDIAKAVVEGLKGK